MPTPMMLPTISAVHWVRPTPPPVAAAAPDETFGVGAGGTTGGGAGGKSTLDIGDDLVQVYGPGRGDASSGTVPTLARPDPAKSETSYPLPGDLRHVVSGVERHTFEAPADVCRP